MTRLDLVIFGATGYTGKHTVKEMVNLAKKYPGMTWAIAGRSKNKLEKVLQWVSTKVAEDVSSVKIIIAAVEDEKSLKEMCAQAKVIVNCCGPYRLYGEPVVKAAIDSKTHYVDVTAEPQFMETMQLVYDKAAQDAGVFIISACGFASIPADLGIMFLQQEFDGTLNSVESYLSIDASRWRKSKLFNYGTWESLIYGLANYQELVPLRKKLFPENLPTLKPKLKTRWALHQRSGWCLPYVMTDMFVVYRTQRHLHHHHHQRFVQFMPYVEVPTLGIALMLVLIVIVFIMSQFSFTRRLLLDYPGICSLHIAAKESPNEEDNEFPFAFELHGVGWPANADVDLETPNKKIVAKVSGTNPGYGATPVALLHSALTILRERDNMPATGGVMTTGVAFRNTTLIQRLTENNLVFEIVSK